MNREIKYRGRDICTGEWIYGDLRQRIGCLPSIIHTFCNKGKLDYCETPIHRVSLGQSTGLLDKNNKEIYEGDIVKEKLKRAKKDGDILQICFDDYEWCGKNDVGASTSFYLLATYHELEVIGNIHDNPELLKGGEK